MSVEGGEVVRRRRQWLRGLDLKIEDKGRSLMLMSELMGAGEVCGRQGDLKRGGGIITAVSDLDQTKSVVLTVRRRVDGTSRGWWLQIWSKSTEGDGVGVDT